MGAIEPRPGMANLDPGGKVGRIFVGEHCYIVNIYIVGFMVSEKKIFKGFPI